MNTFLMHYHHFMSSFYLWFFMARLSPRGVNNWRYFHFLNHDRKWRHYRSLVLREK